MEQNKQDNITFHGSFSFKIFSLICLSLLRETHGKFYYKCARILRNPERDMRVLFFYSFRKLNMLFERLNILFAQFIIFSNNIMKLL